MSNIISFKPSKILDDSILGVNTVDSSYLEFLSYRVNELEAQYAANRVTDDDELNELIHEAQAKGNIPEKLWDVPDISAYQPVDMMSERLWRINKNSVAYTMLSEYYDNDTARMKDAIRGYIESDTAMYFTSGGGYDWVDCDLLGGDGSGLAVHKFDDKIASMIHVDVRQPDIDDSSISFK